MLSLSLLSPQLYFSVLIRLVTALIFGGIIGIERANSKHDAGLRTHIIVCIGAASVMIISQLIADSYGNITDVTRLGAQVISGIGFLGVGCIIVNRNRIQGLTTAAGLWTTACLGLVIGAGFLEVAATMMLLMMFTIFVLRPLSLKLRPVEITFEVMVNTLQTGTIDYTTKFTELGYDIISVKALNTKSVFVLHLSKPKDKNALFRTLLEIEGVLSISEQ